MWTSGEMVMEKNTRPCLEQQLSFSVEPARLLCQVAIEPKLIEPLGPFLNGFRLGCLLTIVYLSLNFPWSQRTPHLKFG